jgi:hypothetical protein
MHLAITGFDQSWAAGLFARPLGTLWHVISCLGAECALMA